MVSFILYDLIFLVFFTGFVVMFLYKRRRKLQKEGIMYLYRTSVGLKIIDYIGKKYKKTLKVLSYIVVITGYALMAAMIYLVGQIVYIYYKFPEVVQAVKVPPIMPLVPYLPELFKIDFLPPFYFTYWILIIAVVAIVHEFSHGIFARYYNVRVKSTGFGFLGPFLAAFVEPDEKQMKKKPIFQQITILSAGTFANVLTTIFFFAIIWIFFTASFVPSGVIFNTYSYGVIDVASISKIGNVSVIGLTLKQTYEMFDKVFEKENQTKVIVYNESFIIYKDMINSSMKDRLIMAYNNAPAISQQMKGAIISVNDIKTTNRQDLANEINKYSPGEKVIIKTNSGNETLIYHITLVENPQNSSKPFIGIGFNEPQTKGVMGQIYKWFSSFKDPGIYYQPINGDWTIFIYNFLWWMILISLSVALVNMLPLGIFDGGRVFFLTILGITKSEKIAQRSFKTATYILLFLVALLMFFWLISFF